MPLKSLDELLAWADIVTLHIPRTKETTNLLVEARMRAMKPGAYLINAARGGLVDEAALLRLLDEGHLGGAALDTFATEPLQKDSPLRAHPKLILTPHLGASTSEAQQAVSTILARQIIDFVATGAVAGCVNLPPLTAEAAREVGPWMPLMSALGRLAARLVPAPTTLAVTYAGRTEALDTRPLTRLLVAALLGSHSGRVTPVNALQEAAARGLVVAETIGGDGDGFDRLLRLRVEGDQPHARDRGDAASRPARGAAGRRRDRIRPAGARAADAQRGPARHDRHRRFAARRGRHQHRQLRARRGRRRPGARGDHRRPRRSRRRSSPTLRAMPGILSLEQV